MSKNDYIVKAFESIGETLNHKDVEISLLKYENEKLKEKLKDIEEYLERYMEGINER